MSEGTPDKFVEMESISNDEKIPETLISDKKQTASKRVLGIFCLLGVVIMWVGSSILMQYLFKTEEFNKPLFTTYLNTTLFTVYLIGGTIKRRVLCNLISGRQIDETKPSERLLKGEDNNNEESPIESKPKEHTIRDIMKLSLMFCPLWFILTMTSVSSNTILSSTSSLFTLILSIFLRVEKFQYYKLVGVLLTFGGVILVSLTDTDTSGKDTIIGDLLALFSACTYAFYVTLYKKAVKNEETFDNTLFLGFLGFFNMLIIWPILIIFNYLKFEVFEVPHGMVVVYLLINSLFGTVLSDWLWLMSILFLSPVIATVGLSLTIPFAMIADLLLDKKHFVFLYILGAILVAAGFMIVNMQGQADEKIKGMLERMLCFWRRKKHAMYQKATDNVE